MKLIDADKLKDSLLVEGNLGYVKTLKDVEQIIDFQVDNRLCLQIEVRRYDYDYPTQRGSKEKEIRCKVFVQMWMYILG